MSFLESDLGSALTLGTGIGAASGGGRTNAEKLADPSGKLGVEGRGADPLDLFGDVAGAAAEEAEAEQLAALDAAMEEERRSRAAGQEFLAPFGGIGQRGVEESSFLANPEEQFEFLQNNPLFKMALDNANEQTLKRGAAGGRLSAGDTLTRLSGNVLQSAQPLIANQRQDINNLLNLGSGIAQTQANVAIGEGSNVGNLLTDAGNVKAQSTITQNAADQKGAETAASIFGKIFGFSDSRLKKNAVKTGEKESGYDIWAWEWNNLAEDKFGLAGRAKGVMLNDVIKSDPECVIYENGYGKVNYQNIGVQCGY